MTAARPKPVPATPTPTPAGKSILIVEDEPDICEMVRFKLAAEGYECRTTSDGAAALHEIDRRPPDLIILDRMLPGLSGDELMARLRLDPRTRPIPVIMLTAKAEEVDELVGLSLGADDYVCKPFSMKVLIARVAALLRRLERAEDERELLTAGPIVLDAGRHEVSVAGRAAPLTATEFRLLRALMQARGRVLDRSQLIDKALGEGVAVTDRTIDVHVTSMRKKLAAADEAAGAGQWIRTVRGFGYAFRSPADEY